MFGFPDLWDAAYKAHANVCQAIDKVQSVANELVKATENSTAELTRVLGALTIVNVTAMTDNNRFGRQGHGRRSFNHGKIGSSARE